MNRTERDAKIAEVLPIVDRIVQRLRIDENYADDARQAGYETAMKLVDKWATAHQDVSWDMYVHGWLRPSVATNILREQARLRPEADCDLSDLEASAAWASLGSDEQLAVQPELGDLLPVVNDRNEDNEQSQLREKLMVLVTNLRNTPARRMMLAVLAGHSVSEASAQLGLTQSSGDRLYQKTVLALRTAAGNAAE